MTEWRFEIRIKLTEHLTDDQLDDLMDAAAQDGWDAVRDPVGIALISHSLSDKPEMVLSQLASAAVDWLAERDRTAALVDIRATTDDVHTAETLRPDTPELLAAGDVAELLSVSRQRVHQLASDHPRFPAPYARLSSGPVWTRPAIEAFDRSWARRPGRPARHAS